MPRRINKPFPTFCFLFPIIIVVFHPSVNSADTSPEFSDCSRRFNCGGSSHIDVSFPFLLPESPRFCGVPGYELYCRDDDFKLTLNLSGDSYVVQDIDYDMGFLTVVDSDYLDNSCPKTFRNTTMNSSLFVFSNVDFYMTVYVNCSIPFSSSLGVKEIFCLTESLRNPSYFKLGKGPASFLLEPSAGCELASSVPLTAAGARSLTSNPANFSGALTQGFGMKWIAGKNWCKGCVDAGGVCGYNSTRANDPICFCPDNTGIGSCSYGKKESSKTRLIIYLSTIGGSCFVLLCSTCFFIYRRHKKKMQFSPSLNRTLSSAMSSKPEPDLSSSIYTLIFSYDELYQATNGFDSSNELGDGGFGTVYKGKLKDGRVVAVKRLYENNYRRVEQFMNEVKIVSLLRHQNLVSLYGCTSRHSPELLLVYEFVPNGTIADHLHGSRASQSEFLSWKTRMRIAIETADALNYLHSVEPQIIHRDIKTNNILLDNNFHVKVADFGISRLFPLDATHVSTAPQGTPGYVDPDYFMCFQLTDKSDIYSFGVVLMELISSKPAVDMKRDRNEINLAYMAIEKIQKQELHQFVDPRLGFQSDRRVNATVTQVAWLAIQCLQMERVMRPSIKEVLQGLRAIESGRVENEVCMKVEEEARLLHCTTPYSPDSVPEKRWVSCCKCLPSLA